jgi:hypothetical protein
VAARVVLYAAFCLPPGRELVVIEGGVTVGGAAVTARLRDFVALCELASVTRTVKLLVPFPEGVPEIAPLPALSASPAGSAPETMDQL